MYNPVIKTMTNEELNKVRIFFADGTEKETTVEEAERIVPVAKSKYFGPSGVKIVEKYKDGSEKTYISRMEEEG